MGSNLLIVFQENFLFCDMFSGVFVRVFSPDTLTDSSCQFVRVDAKVNTTLLVLRGIGHAGKRLSQKWGSVLVVSITWCRSRSVIQIMWGESRSMTKVL